jgi:hypothetical protein
MDNPCSFPLKPVIRAPKLDARLRPAGTRAEQDMIDSLSTCAQLVHQLDHRHHVTSGADAVRAADADQIRFAALCPKLLAKLTQFFRAAGAIDPVLPGAEESVEQEVSAWQVGPSAIQNQLALESGLGRRRGRLTTVI